MNESIDPAVLCRDVVRLGLVSDTHVPDRVARLHPGLLEGLQIAGVDLVVHLGDICEQSVLADLARVAPLLAVRGNRDWVFLDPLPLTSELVIHGKRLLFMHGHGSAKRYFIDKMRHAIEGYRIDRYLNVFEEHLPGTDVIAFGHTHFPENHRQNGCLIMNPGSASVPWTRQEQPGFGIIEIRRDGRITSKRVALTGYKLINREWRPAP